MLLTKVLEFGKVRISSLVFEDVGDVLPMHNHEKNPDFNHVTVISKGSFAMRGKGWEKTVSAGDIIDWQPEVFHEFTALEDDSKLINILK